MTGDILRSSKILKSSKYPNAIIISGFGVDTFKKTYTTKGPDDYRVSDEFTVIKNDEELQAYVKALNNTSKSRAVKPPLVTISLLEEIKKYGLIGENTRICIDGHGGLQKSADKLGALSLDKRVVDDHRYESGNNHIIAMKGMPREVLKTLREARPPEIYLTSDLILSLKEFLDLGKNNPIDVSSCFSGAGVKDVIGKKAASNLGFSLFFSDERGTTLNSSLKLYGLLKEAKDPVDSLKITLRNIPALLSGTSIKILFGKDQQTFRIPRLSKDISNIRDIKDFYEDVINRIRKELNTSETSEFKGRLSEPLRVTEESLQTYLSSKVIKLTHGASLKKSAKDSDKIKFVTSFFMNLKSLSGFKEKFLKFAAQIGDEAKKMVTVDKKNFRVIDHKKFQDYVKAIEIILQTYKKQSPSFIRDFEDIMLHLENIQMQLKEVNSSTSKVDKSSYVVPKPTSQVLTAMSHTDARKIRVPTTKFKNSHDILVELAGNLKKSLHLGFSSTDTNKLDKIIDGLKTNIASFTKRGVTVVSEGEQDSFKKKIAQIKKTIGSDEFKTNLKNYLNTFDDNAQSFIGFIDKYVFQGYFKQRAKMGLLGELEQVSKIQPSSISSESFLTTKINGQNEKLFEKSGTGISSSRESKSEQKASQSTKKIAKGLRKALKQKASLGDGARKTPKSLSIGAKARRRSRGSSTGRGG